MTQSSSDNLFNPENEPQTSPQCAIPVGCSSACEIIDSLLLESDPEDEISTGDPPPDAIQQMHAAVGAVSSAVKSASSAVRGRRSNKLKGWGKLIELCTSEQSNLGIAANDFDSVEVIRVTKNVDWSDPETVCQVTDLVRENPGIS